MARLPTPGSDDNTWGDVLNDFLATEHNADGTQKPFPQNKVINLTNDLAGKAPVNNPVFTGIVTLPADPSAAMQAATKQYVDNAASSGSTPDADATTKGKVQLAGDLGGTAASPTVPGLATKVPTSRTVNSKSLNADIIITKSDVGLANAENTSDASKPVSTATQTALNAKEDTANKGVAGGYAPLDGTGKVPTANLPAASSAPDATTTTKGVVQLAGDLAGTAASPTVPGLAGKASTADLTNHTGNTSNPHSVTKAQVGLGSVDNTSDASKPISTATQTALNAKQNSLGFTPENSANKGVANGYASLDTGGKVPATQLPSYVDEVAEYANLAAFPATGTASILYVALDTNKTYRWSGSAYIEISPSEVNSVAGRTGIVTLTKSDVGLGSVDNTSDASKPVSTATQTALDAKQNSLGFTPENIASKGAASGYASLGANSIVPTGQLGSGTADNTKFLRGDQTWGVVSTTAPDATTTAKGVVQLAGDLAGTAASPTVPGLAGKASTTDLTNHTGNTSNPHSVTKAQVGLGSVDNTSDAAKNSATVTLTNKTITDNGSNIRANSLKSATTTVDISAATAPTAGQVLTASSSTAAAWAAPSGGAASTAYVSIAAPDSPQAWKDAADYTATGTNDETVFASAVAALPATGGEIEYDGTFTFGGTVTITKPVRLVARNTRTSITRSTAVPIFFFQGTNAAGLALAANAVKGSTTITLSNASSLTAGDYLILRSSEAWAGAPSGAVHGEIVRIRSIATNTLTLWNPINDSYSTANSGIVVKLSLLAGCEVNGGIFKRQSAVTTTNTDSGYIRFRFALDPVAANLKCIGHEQFGVAFDNCVGGLASDIVLEDATFSQAGSLWGYGIVPRGATQGLRITNVSGRRCQIVNGGGDSNGIPRFITVSDCSGTEGDKAIFATHVDCQFWKFENCSVYNTSHNGFEVKGLDHEFIAPRVTNGTGIGIYIAADSATIYAQRCRIIAPNIQGIVNGDGSVGVGIAVQGTGHSIEAPQIRGVAAYGISLAPSSWGEPSSDHSVLGGDIRSFGIDSTFYSAVQLGASTTNCVVQGTVARDKTGGGTAFKADGTGTGNVFDAVRSYNVTNLFNANAAAVSSSSVSVQDEASAAFTARPKLNFTGAGVTATDDSVNNRVNISIPGGSSAATSVVVNQQSGTAYTTVASDAGKVVEMTDIALATVTIPANIHAGSAASSDFIEIYAAGTGGVSVVAGSGLTMRPSSPISIPQYSSRRVRFRSATECIVE